MLEKKFVYVVYSENMWPKVFTDPKDALEVFTSEANRYDEGAYIYPLANHYLITPRKIY